MKCKGLLLGIFAIGLCSMVITSCSVNMIPKLPGAKQPEAVEPDAAAYFEEGNDALEAGRYEKAVMAYTKSIELNPDYAPTYYNRGLAHNKMQSREKALANFTKTIQMDPEYGNAYIARAMVYYRTDRCDEAWKDVNRAMDLKTRVRQGFVRSLREKCPSKDLGAVGKLPPQEAVKRLKRVWHYNPTQEHFGMGVVQGQTEAVELFLAAGLPADSKHMGDPVLCHAISSFQYGIARRLIRAGANVNTPDGRGNAPLVLAVSQCAVPKLPRGNTKNDLHQLIQTLIDAGADVNARFLSGQSAHEFAGIAKCPDVQNILKKAGAE